MVIWLESIALFSVIYVASYPIGIFIRNPSQPPATLEHFLNWWGGFLIVGTIAAIGLCVIFFRDLHLRKGDDYKFCRKQMRHVKLSSPPESAAIETALGRLQYNEIDTMEYKDGSFEITAVVMKFLRHQPLDPTNPKPYKTIKTRIRVCGHVDGTVLISAEPVLWWVHGDYSHGRFFLLEEFLDEMHWGQQCFERKNKNSVKIVRA
jgi:hypothetical protein